MDNIQNQKPILEDKKRILIVDDEIDILRVLEILLKDQYEVIKASDGATGFTYALRYLPDLIILDIMMPKMSGYQFCDLKKNNNRLRDVPILVISAKGTLADIDFGLKKGASAYHTKPLDNTRILHTVETLLKNNPMPKTSRPSYEDALTEITPDSQAPKVTWDI